MSTSIGLDIGWRAIKLVQLEKSPKGIRLLKTGAHLIPYKEKETESERLEAITKGIGQLLSELRISPSSSFNLAVSGQSVFIRTIQVIAVSYEKLRQHIRFEAEQHIPFALNEVLWDYCLVNPERKKHPGLQEKRSGEWRVILAAIKKNLVDRQREFISRIRGKCRLIDVGPIAFHSASCFMDAHFLKQTIVLLDMGARGTNLIIAGNGEVWVRSFPLGADRFTQAVSEKMKIAFNEAEVLKQRVGLGPAPDSGESAVVEAIKPAVTDLLEEIQRSLEYYHTQVTTAGASHPKPAKMVLGGGGALLKGIVPLFQEKLGTPVELWSGFQNLSSRVSPAVSQWPQVQFGTAMGLALRGLVTSPIELNLLREEVNRHAERKTLRLYGGGSLFLILGMLGIMAQATRSEYQKKAGYLEEIKKTIKTYQSYEPKIKELELKNHLLKNQVSSLYGVLRQRQTWLDVLQRLEKSLPKEVWLMSYEGTLDLTSGSQDATAGVVRIVGRSLSYQGVTEFVSNLKNSVQFTQVKPVSSNIKKSETGDEIVEFQVEMKIAWQ